MYLALCGGVGGAKLADGLTAALAPDELRVAINVGDDFEHLSLTVCPDIDTVLYTLAGCADPGQGWGRAAESWLVLDEIRRLGGEDWFLLGDKDIALHLLRRSLLDRGLSLTEVTADLSRRLGVRVTLLPVTDDRLRTLLQTDAGKLPFQDYFVKRRCEPRIQSIQFDGADTARLNPRLAETLDDYNLEGIILCPSNPYLSIAPMLAVRGFREALRAARVPVIAVSPIVGGEALKGPAAKIMRELGKTPTAAAIAVQYADFVDAVVVDERDASLADSNSRLRVAPTVMRTAADRRRLAEFCIDLADEMRFAKGAPAKGPSGGEPRQRRTAR